MLSEPKRSPVDKVSYCISYGANEDGKTNVVRARECLGRSLGAVYIRWKCYQSPEHERRLSAITLGLEVAIADRQLSCICEVQRFEIGPMLS